MTFAPIQLRKLYLDQRRSVFEIAQRLHCSEGKINYWLKKLGVQKRTIAEAIYTKHNPNGDPFSLREPKSLKEALLYGLGLGLFWGEGTQRNTYAIRLGNTDPLMLKKFIEFLETFYRIRRQKLRFGLQIFSDMPPRQAARYWQKELQIPRSQFQKIIVTPARSIGTYRRKTRHGVLTVQYHNKKLREILGHQLARVAQSAEQRNGNA